ncbi:hypothetical protein AJ88_37925 [Mesorhizobium amorphae CCBAU 01583]|nr:hypothetical protein AJ88_37925 [Mesorhizobium amorphae CCBAU 01583]
MGFRLPADLAHEHTMRSFLATISSQDATNRAGLADYKTANTDMIAEAVSGRPTRSYLADIADAAGIEGCLYITADREGFPNTGCGACVTARYGSLFVKARRHPERTIWEVFDERCVDYRGPFDGLHAVPPRCRRPAPCASMLGVVGRRRPSGERQKQG